MIVLDTHAFIWSLTDRRRLSRAAAAAINREFDIRLPAICFWEVSLLAVRERIPLRREDVPRFFAEALKSPSVKVAQLTPEIGVRAAQLFPHGRMDPADQLIAATALVLDAPLVTSDERLRDLPGLRTIW